MGTSASSMGPGAGVALVPPWVEAPAGGEGAGGDGEEHGTQDGAAAPARPTTTVAPPSRFGTARTHLGSFSSSGSASGLRKGLRDYVGTGLGGAGRATQRMGGTVRKSGSLYGVLNALGAGTESDYGIDAASLSGLGAREIADHLALAVSPIDGTLDAETSRESVARAFAELLGREPEADLTALTDAQIEYVLERYIGQDICRRIELDVGKTILTRAPDAATAVRRFDEMRSYVHQCVAASFRRRRARSIRLTRERVSSRPPASPMALLEPCRRRRTESNS